MVTKISSNKVFWNLIFLYGGLNISKAVSLSENSPICHCLKPRYNIIYSLAKKSWRWYDIFEAYIIYIISATRTNFSLSKNIKHAWLSSCIRNCRTHRTCNARFFSPVKLIFIVSKNVLSNKAHCAYVYCIIRNNIIYTSLVFPFTLQRLTFTFSLSLLLSHFTVTADCIIRRWWMNTVIFDQKFSANTCIKYSVACWSKF